MGSRPVSSRGRSGILLNLARVIPTVLLLALACAVPPSAVAGGRPDVPTFARLRYEDVYPGVNLVFYGTERELEYDLLVAPGADPGAVALAFEGADSLRVDASGDLLIATAAGELRLRRPVIYEEGDDARRKLDGGYVVEDGRVRFHVAGRDARHALVIDPVLGYSSFLGGSGIDQGFEIGRASCRERV